MRSTVSFPALAALALTTALAASAAADCPPDCVGGGGPATNDCVIVWGGIEAPTSSCVDGASCDLDGAVNGSCTFPLSACLDADGSCAVGSVSSAKVAPAKLGGALQAAMSTLRAGACTTPGFTVPVKYRAGALAPIKQGVAKLRVTAVADGKKDVDRLALTCLPGVPSFEQYVRPIFEKSCAIETCHDSVIGDLGGLSLEPEVARATTVGMPADAPTKLPLVEPGSIKRSFLARKLLGKGLPAASSAKMPEGCPVTVPCLTNDEVTLILSWIQGGAPDN